jgi:hypothetical protein
MFRQRRSLRNHRHRKSAKLSGSRRRSLKAIGASLKTRAAEVQRTLREAELLRKRGQLIDRATAVKQAAYIIIATRQRFLLLPDRLARATHGLDVHKAKLVIDKAIRDVLDELSENLPNAVIKEQELRQPRSSKVKEAKK